MGAVEAAEALAEHDDDLVLDTLQHLNPAFVGDILPELSDALRARLIAKAPARSRASGRSTRGTTRRV